MPMRFILLLLSLAFITCAEGVLWMAFRRRARNLDFPKELDRTGMRLYGFKRVRAIALAHAVALMAIAASAFLFLW